MIPYPVKSRVWFMLAIWLIAMCIPSLNMHAAPAPLKPLEVSGPLSITQEKIGATWQLRFSWHEVVSAAAFQGGKFIWIGFDKEKKALFSGLNRSGSSPVIAATALDHPTGTIVRVELKDDITGTLSRRDNDWILELKSAVIERSAASQQLWKAGETDENRRQLTAEMPKTGKPMLFSDPQAEQTYLLIPVRDDRRELSTTTMAEQFQVLATLRGSVVSVLGKMPRVERRGDAIILSVERAAVSEIAVPESPKPDDAAASLPEFPIRLALLDLSQFAETAETAVDVDHRLLKDLSSAPSSNSVQAHLALMKHYLVTGRSLEAASILARMQKSDPQLFLEAENKLLLAAAHILARRYDSPSVDLLRFDPPDSVDTYLWRGKLLAARNQSDEARKAFQDGAAAISAYPRSLQSGFLFDMGEIAVKSGDREGLQSVITPLSSLPLSATDEARLSLFRAQKVELDGLLSAAIERYRAVEEVDRRPYSILAYATRTDIELRQKAISLSEAIDRRDAMRFWWRGDRIELTNLSKLADLYAESGDFRGALRTLRRTIALFPKSPEAKQSAGKMAALFKSLFVDGTGNELPPLELVSLFDEFRELTPAGPEGEAAARRLADRLADLDLPKQAGMMLEAQLLASPGSPAKNRMLIDLAKFRLNDRNPEKALDALRQVEGAKISDEERTEKQLLEGRSYLELQNYDAAIKVLTGNLSDAAEWLRAEVFWRQKQWKFAAEVLSRLAEARKLDQTPIPTEDRALLLRLAVAVSFSGDETRVRAVRERYQKAMDMTPDGPAFQILTGRVERDTTEFRQLATKVAASGTLDSFMAAFRGNPRKGEK